MGYYMPGNYFKVLQHLTITHPVLGLDFLP
jgi:hypothetical protein